MISFIKQYRQTKDKANNVKEIRFMSFDRTNKLSNYLSLFVGKIEKMA